MPPFQYRTVQDPYVGSITNLMGAGPAAEAQSIRDVGAIRAQESLQKGDIRANLIGNLGQIAGEAYSGYQEAKADEVYAELMGELHDDVDFGFDRPIAADSPTPWAAGGVQMPDQERPPGVGIGAVAAPGMEPGPPPAGLLGATSPTLAAGDTGILGSMPGMETEAMGGPSQPHRGQYYKYVTKDGRHDVTALRRALRERGVSSVQTRRLLSQADERNESITQFNAETARLGEREKDVQDDIALAALMERNGNASRQDYVDVLGAERGMAAYAATLEVKGLESQLATANAEEIDGLLRTAYIAVSSLASTGPARDGILAGMIDTPRLRELMGNNTVEALVSAGYGGFDAMYQAMFGEPVDQPSNNEEALYAARQELFNSTEGTPEHNNALNKISFFKNAISTDAALGRAPTPQPDYRTQVDSIYTWYWGEKRKLEEIDRRATQDPDMFVSLLGDAARESPALALLLASDIQGEAPLAPGWLAAKLADLETFRDQRLAPYQQQGAPGMSNEPIPPPNIEAADPGGFYPSGMPPAPVPGGDGSVPGVVPPPVPGFGATLAPPGPIPGAVAMNEPNPPVANTREFPRIFNPGVRLPVDNEPIPAVANTGEFPPIFNPGVRLPADEVAPAIPATDLGRNGPPSPGLEGNTVLPSQVGVRGWPADTAGETYEERVARLRAQGTVPFGEELRAAPGRVADTIVSGANTFFRGIPGRRETINAIARIPYAAQDHGGLEGLAAYIETNRAAFEDANPAVDVEQYLQAIQRKIIQREVTAGRPSGE